MWSQSLRRVSVWMGPRRRLATSGEGGKKGGSGKTGAAKAGSAAKGGLGANVGGISGAEKGSEKVAKKETKAEELKKKTVSEARPSEVKLPQATIGVAVPQRPRDMTSDGPAAKPSEEPDNQYLMSILKKEPAFLDWLVRVHVPYEAEHGNMQDSLQVDDMDPDQFIKSAYEKWTAEGKPVLQKIPVPGGGGPKSSS